jgi:hypothetical protein
MTLICAVIGVWRSLRMWLTCRLPAGVDCDGHELVEVEPEFRARLQLLRCQRCGHVSVGWRRV